MNKNGKIWYDTQGDKIQAHGGMVLKYGDVYYWYGQRMEKEKKRGEEKEQTMAFGGFSCYSSKDCLNWENRGIVLESIGEDTEIRLGERPKVLYNEKTEKFVMWFHYDSLDYTDARAGVAVASDPAGPFQFLYAIRPNRSDCRDMTLFQDTDGRGYLIHSSDWNKTLRISQLTEDYLNVSGVYANAFIEQEREAPAVCIHEGKYYMITSGCTGWDPNGALYGVSSNILAGWKLIDNPCVGKDARKTFMGQSTCIFEKDARKYLMLDHWRPGDLENSGYSMLPVEFRDGEVTVRFQEDIE